ncbi:MAG: hypothetical protein JW733_03260, partial [Coriobacteriia bacterium]|nr:hypothetical protein [Coriobacteriia bacterium]
IAGCSDGTDGASLVKSKCGSCHSVDWVTDAGADTRADWEGTVARMEAKGLTVTDEERAIILEHLDAEYGAE